MEVSRIMGLGLEFNKLLLQNGFCFFMDRFVHMVTVRRKEGDAAWYDGDCRHAFELKQAAYHCCTGNILLVRILKIVSLLVPGEIH